MRITTYLHVKEISKIYPYYAPWPGAMINTHYLELPLSRTNIHGSKGPGRIAQSVGHLTCKSEVLGSIPGLATYFRFSFRCFKRGSCQLLAKVCARSTG